MKRKIIGLVIVSSLTLFSGYNLYFKSNTTKSIKKSNISNVATLDKINTQQKGINYSSYTLESNSKRFNLQTDQKLLSNKFSNQNNNFSNILKNKITLKINQDINKFKKKETKTFKTKKEPKLINQIQEHTVKKGENLSIIANQYGINIDTLLGANDITNMNNIKPGMKLKVLPINSLLYKVNPGESLWEIARKFDIQLDKIIEANKIRNPNRVQLNKLLILPEAKPQFGYQDRLKQKFISPVTARISSPFGRRWGRMHEGLDYGVSRGTTIRAARSGKVVYSGWARGYGKVVIIEHREGVRTLYAHNSKLLVSSGERVYRGQTISKSGNTGRSTGPHLHFEIQINGRPVNPLNYLE
ncbi:LysM peptidoglycan-binding domain-containing M23 family metallopeptidase [Selenihalanaerobacter shriftii]|uniref:Murein DD-endopeptidase MepM and murein hydrolase activator NlpD, contain LysM domain n=1 Tax=Selenihalanaerobacter shriftii TaxID=142842 RepID=A0A1T4JM64_9FIRM|nr:M23 family metallopeptidase [Selenihalanaerobacter shriftii]SJZ31231.1 Murein DD-endopeptidase MepM and murein hydrolase activator NlpD, contain LysM domain [Selenihalanaerobacter shriftii]